MSFARLLLVSVALGCLTTPVLARDAAFMEPGTGAGMVAATDALKVEPKPEVDLGDSVINVVRRTTLFFVNQNNAPIKIEKIATNSDSNVTGTIVNDDCSKQGVLPSTSRCSVEFAVTPTAPGSWGIEVLVTHNGPGRISRAKIIGKSGGDSGSDKKERGLALSARDAKPVDFGSVEAGDGKVVRSAVMVNDGLTPLTIYSIDVIEADKSLQKLDQGCAPDMELKPGESCPVTLVWMPTGRSIISTDLIIRHSGQLGFAVVPIRGVAKGGDGGSAVTGGSSSSGSYGSTPPTPNEVAREVARNAMPVPASSLTGTNVSSSVVATGNLHLIGTVGDRALFMKPDGSTAVVQAGESMNIDSSTKAVVESVQASSAVLSIKGKKQTYQLEVVEELRQRALEAKKLEAAISGDSNNTNRNNNNNNAGGGAAR